MTCNNTQAYTPKPSPYSAMANPLSVMSSPYSAPCYDFVVKTFQNGDFFQMQDDSQFIFNLEDDTI